MTQTLEELKDKLYAAFDHAIEKSESWSNTKDVQVSNAKAAAKLAHAIVAVETRLDERSQEKNGIKLPGKG